MSLAYDLAIMTPFGKGRSWQLPIWADSLGRLGADPARTRLVLLDNSGEGLRDRLVSFTRATPWQSVVILTDNEWLNDVSERREGLSAHMARLTNRMVAATRLPPFVLSLESDIGLADGILGRMMRVMLKQVRAGIVGLPTACRWNSKPGEEVISCYRMNGRVDEWDKKGLRRPEAKNGGEVEEVHALGMNCTLFRGDVLRRFRFTATPNVDGTGGMGHEWGVSKRAILADWKVYALWERPKHYQSAEAWVQ